MKCRIASRRASFLRLASLCLLPWGASPVAAADDAAGQSDPVVVQSPDGRLEIELFTRAASGARQLQYRVSLSDRAVVDASNLGVRLKGGTVLGRDCVVVGHESIQIDSSFEQYPGKRKHVIDRANETTFVLRERGAKPLEWRLAVRAYDDGVALRYRFPRQPGWSDLELSDELTEIVFPAGALATTLPLASFTTSHENRYERRLVDEIPVDWLLGLPLLVELPHVGWAALLEANLTDYAGMYLERGKAPGGRLVSRLSPRPDEPKIAVRAALPHESPWRLILISKEARQLLESDTVLKLNAPSVIKDTSWIKPGKTTFPWWNDYYEVGVPFKMGLNTETAKYYIDFCAEYGIPYHTLDGVNDLAWYGGHIVPYEGADITKAIDGLDLKAVIDYARQKGVRLRLWMHWEAAKQHMARAFPLYQRVGNRRRDDRLHGPRRSGDGCVPARAAAACGRQSSVRDVPRRRGADRPGADVSESAQQRGGAQPGVRQMGRGRRDAGARRHRAAHAHARRTARLSPGHAPRRTDSSSSSRGSPSRW